MLDEPARTAGWSNAEPRKITLPQLLVALSLESMQGQASFNDLSAAPVPNSKKTTSSCDRGYLTAAEVARHTAAEADCIYRHKPAPPGLIR